MRIFVRSLAAVLLLAFAARADPAHPDILGARLGMSVEEIRAILKSQSARKYTETRD